MIEIYEVEMQKWTELQNLIYEMKDLLQDNKLAKSRLKQNTTAMKVAMKKRAIRNRIKYLAKMQNYWR